MNKTNAINAKTSRIFNIKPDNEVEILSPNDKNIQCTLLDAPFYGELRGFNIENKNKRKILIRAIFGWIISYSSSNSERSVLINFRNDYKFYSNGTVLYYSEESNGTLHWIRNRSNDVADELVWLGSAVDLTIGENSVKL
ncbi:hypothetical protein DOY81_011143 [Sarcophaga bullata]|nr:hypothetical protein DOY81_011143 [Sarcophaga bullata]